MYFRFLNRIRTSIYVKYISVRKRWAYQSYKICTLPFLSSQDKALTQAVLCGDANNAEVLLTRGANVNIMLPGGSPALFYAAGNDCLSIVQILLRFGANVEAAHVVTKNTPLSEAAIQGHTDILRMLISHNANVNAAGADGTTPLMRAVLNKKVDAVKMLLEAGADRNIRSKRGSTAPSLAKALKHVELCQMLGVKLVFAREAEELLRPIE